VFIKARHCFVLRWIQFTLSHSVHALPFCSRSHILFTLSHSVHALPFCSRSPIQFTLSHSVHALPFSSRSPILFFQVPFNAVLPSTPRFSKRSLSQPNPCVHLFSLPCSPYALLIPSPITFREQHTQLISSVCSQLQPVVTASI